MFIGDSDDSMGQSNNEPAYERKAKKPSIIDGLVYNDDGTIGPERRKETREEREERRRQRRKEKKESQEQEKKKKREEKDKERSSKRKERKQKKEAERVNGGNAKKRRSVSP